MSAERNPADASIKSPFAPLRTSPPANNSPNVARENAMAAPTFLTHSQSSFHSANMKTHGSFPVPISTSFDLDAKNPIGTPFSASAGSGFPSASSVLIRRLPLNTSKESLRLMTVFSKDLLDAEVLPPELSEDQGFRAAILNFKSTAGAIEAKNMLDGKSNVSNDAKMIVQIMDGAHGGNKFPGDTIPPATATSSSSSVNSSRQPSRFTSTFQSMESVSPPMNATYGSNGSDMNHMASGSHYETIFSPQSPIGMHLTERSRNTGKSLINNDTADDDETGELLKDPLGFAESGAGSAQPRRQTAPQIPIGRLASLSLTTNPAMSPSSMPPYSHQGMGALSAHAAAMSPTGIAGSGPGIGFPVGSQPYRSHNFPPVNPADQNPPCNTLYVGNLPIDTSEEELKATFSKQRGYKRLCFRTKQNGPMCFVEFEDVSFATKALHELYGHMLHNSVKGGIRLSFSKNPLGVRSGQMPGPANSGSLNSLNGMMTNNNNGFTSANGPPPGLSAPPGLAMGRSNFAPGSNHFSQSPMSSTMAANGWNPPLFSGSNSTGGGSSQNAPGSYPSFMMGK